MSYLYGPHKIPCRRWSLFKALLLRIMSSNMEGTFTFVPCVPTIIPDEPKSIPGQPIGGLTLLIKGRGLSATNLGKIPGASGIPLIQKMTVNFQSQY